MNPNSGTHSEKSKDCLFVNHASPRLPCSDEPTEGRKVCKLVKHVVERAAIYRIAKLLRVQRDGSGVKPLINLKFHSRRGVNGD